MTRVSLLIFLICVGMVSAQTKIKRSRIYQQGVIVGDQAHVHSGHWHYDAILQIVESHPDTRWIMFSSPVTELATEDLKLWEGASMTITTTTGPMKYALTALDDNFEIAIVDWGTKQIYKPRRRTWFARIRELEEQVKKLIEEIESWHDAGEGLRWIHPGHINTKRTHPRE